jgi:hypothetical protein
MSHRRNNTTATTPTRPPAGQRSYIVSIDAGAFANVEIVVGGHHRGGVWTPSRTATVKATSKSHHVYAYGTLLASSFRPPQRLTPPLLSTSRIARNRTTNSVPTTTPSKPSTKPTPFSPQPPASASGAWTKRRERERDYVAAQNRIAAEERAAREQLQRRREEARQLADAARRAAAAAEEARRRRLAEKQQERALREERRRLERIRRARKIANAWSSYDARWCTLSQRQQPGAPPPPPLTFERIPWPVAAAVEPLDGRTTRTRDLDELLRPEAICEFLLSPAHSPEVVPKDRIRAALRRWHPDKFARVLGQVVENDKDAVAEGVGIVVRCLNEMLERENHA